MHSAQPRTVSEFLRDAVTGLRASPKRLSPKYLYDREGSRLFDAICGLPEYYVTRTELAILDRHVDAIAALASTIAGAGRQRPVAPERSRVIEPGAGSGTKTRKLLSALGPSRCVEYVPLDIAEEQLDVSAARLRDALPWLRITPVVADFTLGLPLPAARTPARTVVYFPGSTIGNFEPDQARRLLRRFARTAAGGAVLLGVDLKKDPELLHAAYNDPGGVTAAFNKNVLRRMNAELGATFELDAFHHYAFYAPSFGRIEMHLVSSRRQRVLVGGHEILFREGESLCTEHSYKFDLPSAERLGRSAGLALADAWLDEARHFGVLLFQVAPRT